MSTAFWQEIKKRENWILPDKRDPRWWFVCFHTTYVTIGHYFFSFNRTASQIFIALFVCSFLDMLYTYLGSKKFLFPLSGWISGLGLGILFSAPGNEWMMILVSWITMTCKYLITWRGHHVYNPTNISLVLMVLLSGGQAAIAPAYQWGGSWKAVCLVLTFGLILMWRVNKLPAVLSFWATYAFFAFVRSQLTHIPMEITLWAQVSGGAFMLFSFFMITDPKTSPASTKGMILYGIAIGSMDFIFQMNTAVFSLFYALVAVSTLRWFYYMFRDLSATQKTQIGIAV